MSPWKQKIKQKKVFRTGAKVRDHRNHRMIGTIVERCTGNPKCWRVRWNRDPVFLDHRFEDNMDLLE